MESISPNKRLFFYYYITTEIGIKLFYDVLSHRFPRDEFGVQTDFNVI